jgi:hypothetical protein
MSSKSKAKEIFGSEQDGILRRVIKSCNTRDTKAIVEAIQDFNTQMTKLKDDGVFDLNEISGPPGSPDLISHILEQSYARTVAPEAEALNNYKGFSNNVYGEIRHSLVDEFIQNARIKPHHVFLDMGSGIGNVVLQMAGQVLCESHGVEIMETPARLAKAQTGEFLSRMRYYAKPCGRIRLRHGDFLEDPETISVIGRADVIFVNNYAFDADLNHKILNLFLDLKDGTKVISLKAFVSVDRKLSVRNMHSLESIFRVKEYYFGTERVSWMNEGGKYYIHTVDRSWLAKRLSGLEGSGSGSSRSRRERD